MMSLRRSLMISFALSASAAAAQESGAAAPDIGAGARRAAVCFACHNENGIATIPGTPHLAGQARDYLEKALRAYRDGQSRRDATMNAMAKPLSDKDIGDIAAYFSLQTSMNGEQTAAQALQTIERIRPVGIVYVSTVSTPATAAVPAPPTGSGPRSGEDVFQATCAACHSGTFPGAPPLGDRAAWAPRIAQGPSVLLEHVSLGFNNMPARGGCMDCSAAEIEAAVSYMTNRSK